MKKNAKIIIGIGSTLAVVVGTYYFGKSQGWWGSSEESSEESGDGSILDNVGAVIGIINYTNKKCKSFPIKKGSKCKAVYLLQKEINRYSTKKISEDGIWGKNTDKYLNEVKTKRGLMGSYGLDNLIACGKTSNCQSSVDTYVYGSSIIGKVAYVKKDYVNLRTSPKVNNGFVNNLGGKFEGTNTKIGKIIGVVNDSEGGSKKFYKIDMVTYCCRYVREDVVTLKNK